ncbi:MAG: ribonuclease PH [Verrucomicrobiota bacterium]
MRPDNRKNDEQRRIYIQPEFQKHPTASVLIEVGRTRVICAASIKNSVPRWMREQNVAGGWLTAEYQMLPSATPERNTRESNRGQISGRTQEIQRLIGRALRCVVDLDKLGAKTVQIDCDVIDADGGTRCASITGASVALNLALRNLFAEGFISQWPMREHVAATSVGVLDGETILDLSYSEDSSADVDMNIVMTESGGIVELQGTAEGNPFSEEQTYQMLNFGRKGIKELNQYQKQTIEEYYEQI